MFLKKVEIIGFKSFANKTILEFLPACHFQVGGDGVSSKNCGITAVVGPNGSGKSNVVDAIRWAMGEQSMKNLRGKKAEDIIFAGSGKKSQLSSAAVTLHFDNSDKRIPLEFEEVSITRKIFRNGESEYLINGSRCRLLDFVDLLAKAGIGKESYCVINQGMSDAVLSATTVERRAILEDAAGVKQYQIKKERALRKLETTAENLEKTESLVAEIEPHLKILKRQAEKIGQSRELEINLKTKQTKLMAFLWYSFQVEAEKLLAEKNEIGSKMMNAQRNFDKISDELYVESKTIQDFQKKEDLEKERGEIYSKLNELEKENAILDGRMEVAREKVSVVDREKIIPVDLKYMHEKLKHIREKQEKLIIRLTEAETPDELQEIRELARAIQQSLFDLCSDSEKGKIAIKEDFSQERLAAQKILDELIEKKAESSRNLHLICEEVLAIEKSLKVEIEKEKEARKRFFELERESASKQSELNKLKDHFNDIKVRLARVEVREDDLTNEIRMALRVEPQNLTYDGQPIERETLEKEILRLKSQLDLVGGIDPLVLEEYEETRKRFEFLSGESEDLRRAIDSLHEVVGEMNEKIEEELNKAYEKINEEFTKYFRIIFGGGNAYLIKSKIKKGRNKNVEEDDSGDLISEGKGETNEESEKEESGIDIFACPPGKKINQLSMLSGGERSLTSLALLFAIIAYNPPPFSILDEVEAALDEANSRRFSRILQELSGNTQFIAITHNRETMRQASLLYGVTMSQDGISKLLSVRLDQIGQGGQIKG